MKTINILLAFLVVMLFAACDNKFGISDGTYSSVEIERIIYGKADSAMSLHENFGRATLKITTLPGNVKKVSMTTTFSLLGGNGFTEEGYLDGKGHFIVSSIDNITMESKTDTCDYKRDGDFLFVVDRKGILKLTSVLRVMPPQRIDDKRCVALYCFKKNK